MSFLLSDDLVEFQRSLGKLFLSELPLERIQKLAEANLTSEENQQRRRALYKAAVDLGALAAVVPEDLGGLGLGFTSLVAIGEELGRALVPAPITEALALGIVPLLSLKDRNRAQELLERMLAGELATGVPLALSSLSESIWPALSVDIADLILSLKLSSSGAPAELFLLDGEAQASASSAAELSETLDLLRPVFKLSSPLSSYLSLGETTSSLQSILGESNLVLAAELSGIAARVVELTVDYVKTRNQFQRPIGSFQAVQHALADMHVAAEQVRTLVRFAGWCADNDRKQFPEAILGAVGLAAKSVPAIVEKSIQLHGGIGFTFEYPLHLFLRRAHSNAQFMGGAAESFSSLAESFLAK